MKLPGIAKGAPSAQGALAESGTPGAAFCGFRDTRPKKLQAARVQRVPRPVRDLATGIPISDSVETIIILGDRTSDHLTTRCAIARAETRWRKPGRVIRVAWSPEGKDFDDVLREAA
jgi:hypothetical protein